MTGWQDLVVLMRNAEALAAVRVKGQDEWDVPGTDKEKKQFIERAERRLGELADQAKKLLDTPGELGREQGRTLAIATRKAYERLKRAARATGKTLSAGPKKLMDELDKSLLLSFGGIFFLALVALLWLLNNKR
jgi:hypothetical protein